MIYWLESQPVAVIVGIGYLICFMVAVFVYLLACSISKTKFGEGLTFITPSLITPLGVILGLLLVFLSSRVWTSVDRAGAAVAQEAAAVQELRRLVDDLPHGVADPTKLGVHDYLAWVQESDWPNMLAGKGSLRDRLPGLVDAAQALVSYNGMGSGQTNAQKAALDQITKVRDARRTRILQSRALVGLGQWIVVLALYVHMLVLIGAIHIKRRVAMAASLSIFASAFATCFVLLLVYDRPFRAGGVTIDPIRIEATSD